ncbi:MAG: NTP pyrophosphohydrolase [Acidimicrobiales bacterium]
MLVVDAANVIGSRPDGWWRDRAGAAARFVGRVAAALQAGDLDPPVIVVLEGRSREAVSAGATDVDGLEVVHAPGEGDDTIVEVTGSGEEATVVTADRALADRVRAVDAQVVGPRWLRSRLVDG